jgi:hypothetical protein
MISPFTGGQVYNGIQNQFSGFDSTVAVYLFVTLLVHFIPIVIMYSFVSGDGQAT